MSKPIRIYELYRGGFGFSNQSKYYGRPSKEIWHIAARSIKQAYYFAHSGTWASAEPLLGIVEYSPDSSEAYWIDYQDNRYRPSKFFNAERIKS